MAKKLKYSEDDIDALLEGVFAGTISPASLPEDLYEAIAENLTQALYEGFGANLSTVESLYGPAPAALLTELRTNIYQFSAAKTFNMVEEMRGVLVDGDKILTLNEFKEKANTIFETYNKTWLETEYNTAIGQAETARKWKEIEADAELFPYIKYDAVNDSHVDDACKIKDGVILPVKHEFWATNSPLTHFNCRCILEQLETPNG